MTKRILTAPVLSQHLRCIGRPQRSFPFDEPGVSFWWGGRAAIWQGIHSLGLRAGDRVLVPNYCCGVEISVLLKAGLELAFYRVGPDLVVDMAHIEELCRRPARALFIIHYFGWPQPIRQLLAFARAHDLLLIEDCAHALYAADEQGKALGHSGDMAIFSLRKALPVPNGGVLVLRPDAGRTQRAHRGRSVLIAQIHAFKDMLYQEAERHWPDFVARFRASRNGRPISASALAGGSALSEMRDAETLAFREFDPARGAWPMSHMSRIIAAFGDSERIRSRRRRNFELLLERFLVSRSVRPLRRVLPPGASPWLFPIWVDDREELWSLLSEHGVETYRFWRLGHASLPTAGFEREQALRRHVLALPVHQHLGEADMFRMADVIARWDWQRSGRSLHAEPHAVPAD